MQLIKAILGAVVGGALGVGLLVGVEAFARREYGWIVIFIGLLAGLSMRMIASGNGASYLRGALAALVALGAFIGGKYVVVAIISRPTTPKGVLAAAPAAVDSNQTDDNAAATDIQTVHAPTMALQFDTMIPGAHPAPAGVQGFSALDAVWLVIGALVAYELGKGRQMKLDGQKMTGEQSATPVTPEPTGEQPAGDQ